MFKHRFRTMLDLVWLMHIVAPTNPLRAGRGCQYFLDPEVGAPLARLPDPPLVCGIRASSSSSGRLCLTGTAVDVFSASEE